MSLILIIILLVIVFGGGGGYYAHSYYGGPGLGPTETIKSNAGAPNILRGFPLLALTATAEMSRSRA